MKSIFTFIYLLYGISAYSQCVIEINPNSCSGNNAIINIISGEIYDGYQWYYLPIGSSGNFQPINGATNASLTCDWTSYDQCYIKLDCIYNFGLSYFSNKILLNQADCSLGATESQLSDLRLFPNPLKDYFILSGSNIVDEIQIFNSLGQNIYTLRNSNQAIVDTSFLISGVYTARIVSGNNSRQIQFIKL